MSIKQGDLVTVNLQSNYSSSNVYMVHRKLETECLLSHPLAPNCFLLKADTELNQVAPTLKNAVERCMDYAHRNMEAFDANDAAELKALFSHFVVNRRLSQRQGRTISAACGKIAAANMRNNLMSAIQLVVGNKGLLDDYNLFWFERMSEVYTGKKSAVSPKQRVAIFNQAGFILAQLATNSVPQSGGNLHDHSGEVSKVKP